MKVIMPCAMRVLGMSFRYEKKVCVTFWIVMIFKKNPVGGDFLNIDGSSA